VGHDADKFYFMDPALDDSWGWLGRDELIERWHDREADGTRTSTLLDWRGTDGVDEPVLDTRGGGGCWVAPCCIWATCGCCACCWDRERVRALSSPGSLADALAEALSNRSTKSPM
jgi:hypothetical protein